MVEVKVQANGHDGKEFLYTIIGHRFAETDAKYQEIWHQLKGEGELTGWSPVDCGHTSRHGRVCLATVSVLKS